MTKLTDELCQLIDEVALIIRNIVEILEAEDKEVSLADETFFAFFRLIGERLANSRLKLHRDYLKCVFVGRTSNGKSSVINTLLRNNVFPTGIGHTTNCFITLRTRDIDTAYVEHFKASDLKIPAGVFPLEKLKSLTHALSPEKVDSNDTIRINYPTSSSNVFAQNVFLVDSPGVDINVDYDEWIDKHCHDADLFVLVTNAEAVLMQCERRFFVRVKDKFATPNLLIVNNRWDSSSEHDLVEMNKVKTQQMKIFSDFLVSELGLCSVKEVRSRVFFVSALEEMRSRSTSECSPAQSMPDIAGRIERSEDFQRFERTLQENLSEMAKKDKIISNFRAMDEACEELNAFINCLFNAIIIEKEFVKKSLNIRMQLLKNLESDLARIHQKAANYIERIVMKAKDKLAYDFQQLVCNLDSTIDSIKLTFDPYSLKEYLAYQRLIVDNIESSIYEDLKNRTITSINGQLKTGVDRLTKIYTELVLSIPSSHSVSQCVNIACQQPIHHLYPAFSVIMNQKIETFKGRVTLIPSHFLLTEDCAKYLNSVDNRFSAYSKIQVDHLVGIGTTAVPTFKGRFPEVTLMIPRFSAVILSDYSYTPGFQFSLSLANLSLIASQWSSSPCPIQHRIKVITWRSLAFAGSIVMVSGAVIHFDGRYWKLGVGLLTGGYCGLYLSERYSWDSKKEMGSLKNQFTLHCKQRMQTIIHVSAVTTARQLGSFLHLDLKGLHLGAEIIIRDFHQQVDAIIFLESKVLANEKKFKKIKAAFYVIGQQIVALKKEIYSPDFKVFQQQEVGSDIWQ